MSETELQTEGPIEAQLETEPPQSNTQTADAFIEHYLKAFGNRCFNSPHLGYMSLHTNLGLILRDQAVHYGDEAMDLRISTMAIQDSGTGKDPYLRFTRERAENLCYNVRERSQITSSGAVGDIDRGTVNPVTGKVAVISSPGDLKNLDMILSGEASNILNSEPDQWGNDLKQIICRSQDYQNRIGKRLKCGEMTEYTSKTVFCLVTAPPQQLSYLVFQGGLFPRFYLSIKSISIEQCFQTRRDINDKLGTISTSQHADLAQIDTHLKKIKTWSDSGTMNFTFTKEVRDYINLKEGQRDTEFLALSIEQQEKLKPFIIRFDLLGVKLSCHHAVLDNRTDIQLCDIDYGWERLYEIWRELVAFVEKRVATNPTYRMIKNEKQEKEMGDILKLMGSERWIIGDLKTEIKEKLGIKTNECVDLFKVLESRGRIKRDRAGDGIANLIWAISQDLQNLQDPDPDANPEIDTTQDLQNLQN